jgi:hypothetical protein
MNGNPIQNQTLDSKGSRQSTRSKIVSILKKKLFYMGNINHDSYDKNSPKPNNCDIVNQNKI